MNLSISRIQPPNGSAVGLIRKRGAAVATFGKAFTRKFNVIVAVQPRKPKAEHKAEKQEQSPKAFLFCSLRYTRQVIKEL